MARLQRLAGNRTVSSMVQRDLDEGTSTVKKDDTDGATKGSGGSKPPPVFYMDSFGVAHKSPDPSKLPPILYMDSSGVGHKSPDPSKLPPVLHMDSSGVGHKAPDPSPSPPILYMDSSGVGHTKPDELNADLKASVDEITAKTTLMETESATVVSAATNWGQRLADARAEKALAIAGRDAAAAARNVNAAGSGLTVAREAAKARTAATTARAKHGASNGEKAAVDASVLACDGVAGDFVSRTNWLKKPVVVKTMAAEKGPLNLEAIKTIKDLMARWKAAGLALDAAKPKLTALATTGTVATESEALATEAEVPLKQGTNRWAVVGMLQQKLNKTRTAGNRLSITSLFDANTEAAVRNYQTAAGLTVTGVADLATWQALEAAAPSKTEHGKLTVPAKDEARQAKTGPTNLHPTLSMFDSGPGVKELQQRLLNWRSEVKAGGGKAPFGSFSVDGIFGVKTRSALKDFQKAKGLPQSATTDAGTWALLDRIGSVTTGAQQVEVDQHSEGMRTGGTGKYDWAVTGSRLVVTVKIKFTGASKDPAVNRWLGDIRDIWNSYRAVEVGAAVPRRYDIDFDPRNAAGHHKVAVRKPTKNDPHPRSDAANWYTSDTRRGLAPHEFGHLIGLEDEYNRPEGQYVEATGLEPEVGETEATSGANSSTIASDIHAAITSTAGQPGEDRILAVRKVITDTHGMKKGALARLVAQRYQATYGFDGRPDISTYFAKVAAGNWTRDLTRATSVFTESNASIMGTMGDLNGVDLSTLPDHEHPVQPRHLRHIADVLTLVHGGTTWKVERR